MQVLILSLSFIRLLMEIMFDKMISIIGMEVRQSVFMLL